MLSDIFSFNLNFLQDPDRIVHTPEKVMMVYAWFSAQFLIKHISFQFFISFGPCLCINIWLWSDNEHIIQTNPFSYLLADMLPSIYLLTSAMSLVLVRSWEREWGSPRLLQQERMLSSNVSMLPGTIIMSVVVKPTNSPVVGTELWCKARWSFIFWSNHFTTPALHRTDPSLRPPLLLSSSSSIHRWPCSSAQGL